ncbi:MAG: hypothetical protein ACO3N7_04695 [Kiritimatiellia bacterium]
MTAAGWIVMIAAVTGMSALLVWCVWKVIRTPDSVDHLHSPSDIDPDDD